MKKILALIFIGTLILVVIAYGVALWALCDPLKIKGVECAHLSRFGEFYSINLRGSLFAGFLTLGGFLLSLKAFIIVNMKKEVYDTSEYQSKWRELKRLDNSGKLLSIYGPLEDLSTVLYYSILSCVFTAVSQLTIGLFGNLWTSIFCVWTAIVSVALLIWCLTIIRNNLLQMFSHLNKQKT